MQLLLAAIGDTKDKEEDTNELLLPHDIGTEVGRVNGVDENQQQRHHERQR